VIADVDALQVRAGRCGRGVRVPLDRHGVRAPFLDTDDNQPRPLGEGAR
jgi:hypothetical protein